MQIHSYKNVQGKLTHSLRNWGYDYRPEGCFNASGEVIKIDGQPTKFMSAAKDDNGNDLGFYVGTNSRGDMIEAGDFPDLTAFEVSGSPNHPHFLIRCANIDISDVERIKNIIDPILESDAIPFDVRVDALADVLKWVHAGANSDIQSIIDGWTISEDMKSQAKAGAVRDESKELSAAIA